MSDISFNFDATAAISKLDAIRANIPTALTAVGVAAVTQAQTTITSGGPGTWAPWARNYLPPHQILWEKGTLLRSLTSLSKDENSVTVGSNVTYANALQRGDSRHNLPARPYFIFDNARNEQLGRVFLKYLLNDEAEAA